MNIKKKRCFDRVGIYMDKLTTEEKIAGCSINIMLEDEVAYEHYSGYANIEKQIPIEESTLFRIYSMTKPVTVTAALQLYEQGKFLLHDPVSAYLPEFKEMTICEKDKQGNYYFRPAKKEITIKDLFCMTSGLTYDGTSCPSEEKVGELLKKLYQEFDKKSCSTRDFVKQIAEIPLAFEPGEQWRYGLSHDVLGGLIEVITGEHFGDYVKKHILEPLHMEDTAFHMDENKLARLASIYTHQEGQMQIESRTDIFQKNYSVKSQCESGGAGLVSSLSDYMKFAHTLTQGGTSQEGERILGRQTIELMRADHLKARRSFMNWKVLEGYSYGLGVRTLVDPAEGGTNGTIGEFGWNGMAGTYVAMDPEKQLTIVYMQQMVPSLEEEVQLRLRNIIYGCL